MNPLVGIGAVDGSQFPGLQYDILQIAVKPGKHTLAVFWWDCSGAMCADAQYRLGYMYGTGQGVPKDDATAVSWYRKAAGQGHARAQYNLGAAYANGTGVIQNKETAAEWFFKAGQSFVSEDKRALALRVVDTIERLIPGHALASELLAAIRARFGF